MQSASKLPIALATLHAVEAGHLPRGKRPSARRRSQNRRGRRRRAYRDEGRQEACRGCAGGGCTRAGAGCASWSSRRFAVRSGRRRREARSARRVRAFRRESVLGRYLRREAAMRSAHMSADSRWSPVRANSTGVSGSVVVASMPNFVSSAVTRQSRSCSGAITRSPR